MQRNSRYNKSRSPRNLVHGTKFNVPAHPTDFTLNPWLKVTVRNEAPGLLFTLSDLVVNFISQTGFEHTPGRAFEVRVQRFKIWGDIVAPGEATKTPAPITVAIRDLIHTAIANTQARRQAVFKSYPNMVSRAKLGYEYSKPQQNVVLQNGSTGASDITLLELNGSGPNTLLYYDILIRPHADISL